ncbi:hypothetical protein CHS0354_034968 [Potamilus streckersoni]|uniref:Rhodanese domain-containing protein n=1 Tax=Potamilus streckersoni TaxID=2493646 RepID=A0AAE0SDM1_9BIVA|nr:hypothetical protein CHS0354_034968 [Potamilus streckersoni]
MANLRRVFCVFQSAYRQVHLTRTFAARRNICTSVFVIRSQTITKRIRLSSTQYGDATKFHSPRILVRCYGSHYDKRTDLSYEDLIALINDADIQLIDVRDEKDIKEQGAFPKAVNISLCDLKEALKMDNEKFREKYHIPKPQPTDTNIVFVGYKSVKSSAALEIAHKLGYTKSRHYPGGFEDWKTKQNPS